MSILADKRVTSTNTLITGRCRVYSIWVMGGATAGLVTLRDGGSDGAVKAIIDIPGINTTGTTFAGQISFLDNKDDGINFATDCHATLSVAVGVTAVYEMRQP